MNDLVSAKLVQIADQIQSTLVAKAPIALNILLETARFDAITNIVQPLLAFAICAVLSTITYKFFKKADKVRDKYGHMLDANIVILFILGMLTMSSLIMSAIGLFVISDVFNWIGIWHPDIYIAHQLLNKIGG